MILRLNLIIKYFICTVFSLVSTLIYEENQKFEIWYFFTYPLAYIMATVLILILKRLLSLKIINEQKISFLGLSSLLETVLFFILEFNLPIQSSVGQKLAILNRIIFLYLRFFLVNQLIIIKITQIAPITMIYIVNILIYYYLHENTNHRDNLISLVLSVASLIFIFFINEPKSNYYEINLEILKNLDISFFVIKKGEPNKIVCLQGEIFPPCIQKYYPTLETEDMNFLNNLFLVEKKHFSDNYKKFNIETTPINAKEEFVKLDLDKFIQKNLNFERNQTVMLKVKISKNIAKSFYLSVKKILVNNKKYFIFILNADSFAKKDSYDTVINIFSSKLLKLKNSLNDLVPFFVQLSVSERLSKENHNLLKGALANLKFSISRAEDLIYFELIKNKKIILNLTRIKILDFLEEIIQTIRPLAKSKKTRLKISIEDKILNLNIKTDIAKLRHIILNLFSNAIKYTIDESLIHFNVDFGEEEKQINFSFKDFGVGFEKSKLEEIYLILNKDKPEDYNDKIILENLSLYVSNSLLNALCEKQNLKIESLQNQGTYITFSIDCFIEEEKKEKNLSVNENLVDMNFTPTGSLEEIKINSNSMKFSSDSSGFSNILVFPERRAYQKSEAFKDQNTFGSTKIESASKVRKNSSSSLREKDIQISLAKKCECKQFLFVDYDAISFLPIRFIFNSLKLKYSLALNKTEANKKILKQYNCTDTECQGLILILINCHTPIKESVDTIRELKKILEMNSMNKVHLIGTMSIIYKEEMIQCVEAGLSDFILSPITIQAIKKCLNKWLNLKV